MSKYPPCWLCNHSAGAHPIDYGTVPASSPCMKCDCPGYIAHRQVYRPIEPDEHEKRLIMGPKAMQLILSYEASRPFGGEATLFMQFDDHPYYGSGGEQMLRGIEPGEVPGHMQSIMRVTQDGQIMMRLSGYGSEEDNN